MTRARSTTVGMLPTGTALVFKRLGDVKFSQPVYGSAYHRGGQVEIVLTAKVDESGKVVGRKADPLTDENRVLLDNGTACSVHGATDPLTPDTLPEGTVGAHYCRQSERHAEWAKGGPHAEQATLLMGTDGSTLRKVTADKARTGFCPLCVRKHAADAKARDVAKAAAAEAKAEARKAAKSRVAQAAAKATRKAA